MNAFGKKTLRLTTAALLAGTALGAQYATTARQATAANPRGVGTISITDWQFPDGCSLAQSSVADSEICVPMQDGLVTVDDHLNYIPDLAESIPTLKNGGAKVVGGNLVVTWHLRPNLKWSDGSPLTSQDFVFGTKLNIAVGNTLGIDQITKFETPDARTLRVTYKGVYAPYYTLGVPLIFAPERYLAKKYGKSDLSGIAAATVNDKYNSPSDLWSGPYRLQSYSNGQSVVLEENPYYHGLPASSHPRPAVIKFVTVNSDEAALAAALKSPSAGVDKAEDFQYDDLPVLTSSSAYRTVVQPALFYEHLELNQAGPLKDIRLRQALQYAIDKRYLFHNLFPAVPTKEIDSILMRTPLPNISPWANKSIPISEYNPAKAKALLSQAGYATSYNGSGRHLNLVFATTRTAVRQKDFQILSKFWAAVGIHVSPNFVSGDPAANGGMFSTYANNGILSQRRFDIALFAFQVSPEPDAIETSFDPSLIPTAAKHGGGDQNYDGITDRDQFSLLQRADHTLDQGQRHALLNRWQKLVTDRVYWIMLYARPNIVVHDGKIGNFKPNPSSAGNDWNAFQWYRAS